MAALFAARLAVQLPLYFAGKVALLGTIKLAMGAPPFVALLWVSYLIMRPVLHNTTATAVPTKPATPA
jgi:hypothetical protein